MSDWVWLILIGGVLYLLSKGETSSPPVSGVSGLGVGGSPRRGYPKTEAERLATHKSLYGTSELPPRGTGLFRSIV